MRTPSDELFRFRMLTEVHCGPGATGRMAAHLSGLPTARIVAVADPNVKALQPVRAIVDQLDGMGALTFLDGPSSEPDFDYLEGLKATAAAADPTLVIGIGGGSTMDAAKGLAIVLENPGPCDQYQGLELYNRPGRPCVAIPTLFGSGAEVTPSAVFFNRKKNKKGGINGTAVFPTLAIVDPVLMAEVPLAVSASTAMDSLVHAIESSVSRCSTDVTRIFARQAARTVIAALDGLDGPARMASLGLLAEGAFLAILSLMHSEQGLAGGASYPMGVFHAVPHGVGGGRCLPHAILANETRAPGLYDALARDAIGWSPACGKSAGRALAERLIGYMERYGVPRLLRWLAGVDLEKLSGEIHAFRGVMEQNPIEFSAADIRGFLENMLADEVRLAS
jgi:alcohol dehydrogenase class IV